MENEPKKRSGGTFVGLALAPVVCCGGIILLTTGALGGVGAWLFDGGLTWLALALVVGVGGAILWRRQKPSGADTTPATQAPNVGSGRTGIDRR